MSNSRCTGAYNVVIAFDEVACIGCVGDHNSLQNVAEGVQASLCIGIKGHIREGFKNCQNPVINRHGDDDYRNVLQAADDNLFPGMIFRQRKCKAPHHQQACRHCNIGLVDAEG